MEGGVFEDCTGLTSIVVDENNPVYDSRDNSNTIIHTESNDLLLACNNPKIPDSVMGIWDTTFINMTSIIIPTSVTRISGGALHRFETIYYRGSEDSWKTIFFEGGYQEYDGETIIYSYTG